MSEVLGLVYLAVRWLAMCIRIRPIAAIFVIVTKEIACRLHKRPTNEVHGVGRTHHTRMPVVRTLDGVASDGTCESCLGCWVHAGLRTTIDAQCLHGPHRFCGERWMGGTTATRLRQACGTADRPGWASQSGRECVTAAASGSSLCAAGEHLMKRMHVLVMPDSDWLLCSCRCLENQMNSWFYPLRPQS